MSPNPQPQLITKNARHHIEDVLAILGIIRRGWRLIAIAATLCVTASAIYALRAKTVYNASARLLLLQQAGRPLSVAGGDPFQHLQGQDSLATHLLIIRSPAIVERAIALSGMSQLSVGSVIDRLTVKQPTEEAKVLELGYRAETGDEAMAVMKGVVASYEQFLRDNYQKDTREVITLIVRARDDLSKELKQLEREYLEFRQKSPTFLTEKGGRTFLARRVDQWDQASNQAMARAMQLKAQLELAKKLAGEGAAHNFIATAVNQLSGNGPTVVPPEDTSKENATGSSYEQTLAQLSDVKSQRRGAERLLELIKTEYDSSAANRSVDDPEIVREFYADPFVANLRAKFEEAKRLRDGAARIARQYDPAVNRHGDQMKALEAQIATLWREMGPQLLASKHASGRSESVERFEQELIVLRAREATLMERAQELKAEQLGKLNKEREGMARLPNAPVDKLAEVERQIRNLEGRDDTSSVQSVDRRNSNLIGTLERSAEAIESMKSQIQKLFDDDLDASKKAEIAQLAEENLRSNLERQRTLFDSVASQLKQAQLASDFGSVTAQAINPPSIVPIRPRVFSVLLMGLVAGCGLGGGLAYLLDLMEARVRTITELKSILDLSVIAMVPKLSEGLASNSSHIALLSHRLPRSNLAESYKTARTNIEFLRRNRHAQVILVSSPNPGDGKSTTSSNLAITLALAGRKVLLIDGDLRKPCLHTIYGLDSNRGLVSILQGEETFSQTVQTTAIENLDLLAAGPEAFNPAELLASDLLAALLKEIRPSYDVIVFDTSPFLAVTDPWIISAVADGILLVVRLGSTRRHDIEQTMEVLNTLDAPILGMIANCVKQENLGYGYGYKQNHSQPCLAARQGDEGLGLSTSLVVNPDGVEGAGNGHLKERVMNRPD
jgi:polysaccharide biosynthesis transport protein